MIESLRNVTAREWIRALEGEGFRRRKNKGSHHLYQHPDGRRVLMLKPDESLADAPAASRW